MPLQGPSLSKDEREESSEPKVAAAAGKTMSEQPRARRWRGRLQWRRIARRRKPTCRSMSLVVVSLLLLPCWIDAILASAASVAAPDKANANDGGKGPHERGGGRTTPQQQQQHQHTPHQPSYLLLGVSGTLQEGFPLRYRLDYNATTLTTADDEDKDSGAPAYVPAVFIGRALVRGFKAYLDVKDVGWREYVPMSASKDDNENENDHGQLVMPPHVPNAVVMATGCREHANLYHIYAVDIRQVAHVLGDEPRFLGISADVGLVDLGAVVVDERSDDGSSADAAVAATDESVRRLAIQLSRKKKLARETAESTLTTSSSLDLPDVDAVAIPLVVGVHFHSPSYVESPVAWTLSDGTIVTSYAESLARWVGIDPDDLVRKKTAPTSDGKSCVGDADDSGAQGTCFDDLLLRSAAAWKRLHEKTRAVEQQQHQRRAMADHPAALSCRDKARMGVSVEPSHLRLNFPLGVDDLREFM